MQLFIVASLVFTALAAPQLGSYAQGINKSPEEKAADQAFANDYYRRLGLLQD